MTPEARKKRGKEPQEEEAATPDHIRLNPEDWEDPAGRRIIECHKNSTHETDAKNESDLDAFQQEWNTKRGGQTASEYHKQGAPYMEPQSVEEGREPRTKVASSDSDRPRDVHVATDSHRSQSLTRQPFLKRVLDISTIEVMAFTVFRAMFGKGVRVPLKIEGSMDMDIVVKDTDVVINTNNVTFQPPKLQVWHFIFAYKGKPVLEYGRGIERVKVHYYHAFVMLVAMWWGGKKKRRAEKKADEARDVELTRYAAGNERPDEENGTGRDQ